MTVQVHRVLTDEQMSETIEIGGNVAGPDPDVSVVGVNANDSYSKPTARNWVPGGRERRVELCDMPRNFNSLDFHAVGNPSSGGLFGTTTHRLRPPNHRFSCQSANPEMWSA